MFISVLFKSPDVFFYQKFREVKPHIKDDDASMRNRHSELHGPDKDKTEPRCWLITRSDVNATRCPSLGSPVARAEVDTAVAGSLVVCGGATEQKGQQVTGI